MPSKPTLLLDFDGVLHDYKGWEGPEERFLHPPIEGARHACLLLARDFRLVCFTTRPREMVEKWLRAWGFPQMMVTDRKLPAAVLLDDRALTFTGTWTDDLLSQIRNFQPHWHSAPK